MIGIFYTVYLYNTSNLDGFAVILGVHYLKGEIMKNYFVYVGWSLIQGEEHCVTIGVTSDHWRRVHSRACVVWSPEQLSKSPNRTWDWWISADRLTVAQTVDVVERMRNVQVTWKPENAHLYMARARRHFQKKGVKYV